MEYISDKIGEQYKEWKQNDRVYITAPTGSGKTQFILKVLLPYAKTQGRTILYLVNRKILKAQLLEEVNKYALEEKLLINIRDYIRIKTYQELEENYRNTGYFMQSNAYYIVCDEAHYFLHDSLFNTVTAISYAYIENCLLGDKVMIFISATIQNFYEKMTDTCEQLLKNAEIKGGEIIQEFEYKMRVKRCLSNSKEHFYSGEKDYTYLTVIPFDNIEEVEGIILKHKKSEKWLIFLNDIAKGKQLSEVLKKTDRSAVFINSRYEEDEEARKEVYEITTKGNIDHDIVIATSLLDNGVSISDEELRNLIIFADNEIEFLQMLGRKRQDGAKVLLYLQKKTKKEFSHRLQQVEKSLEVYQECDRLLRCNGMGKLFDELLARQEFYRNARKFLYQSYIFPRAYPNIMINSLSIDELYNRRNHYEKQVQKFDKEDEYAFFRTQLEWLGFTEEEMQEAIGRNKETVIEQLSKELSELLKEYDTKQMNAKENKDFKLKIRKPLRELLRKFKSAEEISKLENLIWRNDVALSADSFNEAMQIVQLPFLMKSYGDGKKEAMVYIINKLENEEK